MAVRQKDYFSLTELQLPSDIWQPFSDRSRAVDYPAGKLIYLQNSPAEQFYYIISGQVRSYISGEDGSERILAEYRSGNLFGEAAFFDQQPRVSNAVTVTPCRLVPIDRARITEIIRRKPEVAMALLAYLARTVRLLSGHIDDSTFLQADQRLARQLVAVFSESDTIRITQEELASAIGVSRMTVSRVLSEYQAQGILKTGYRSLTLLDRHRLNAAADLTT